jgi:hypothetical protein
VVICRYWTIHSAERPGSSSSRIGDAVPGAGRVCGQFASLGEVDRPESGSAQTGLAVCGRCASAVDADRPVTGVGTCGDGAAGFVVSSRRLAKWIVQNPVRRKRAWRFVDDARRLSTRIVQ